VPGLLLFVGWWFCYRIDNLPKFADFLIGVEAEMTKVSWPTQTELIRSSMVVIFFIASLALILFGFDLFWRTVFQFLGII
jgi:preprotein translocase subunit SecE